MIVYILILHYLLYRQHIRQKRHESLTMAIVSVLQTFHQTIKTQETREAKEVIEDDKYN